jgi:hypothetical protein
MIYFWICLGAALFFLSNAIFVKYKRQYDENSYLSNVVFKGFIYGIASLIWSFVILYKHYHGK